MDSLEKMNEALQYIEDNLMNPIDFKEVAKIACCSEYHFKRMFSFLAGVTLSEYIRRRRMTLSAAELKDSKTKVTDIALKYGYNSPNSFSRAFQQVHGITPSEAKHYQHSIKAFQRMTFQLTVKGAKEMNVRMEQKDAFHVVGIKNRMKVMEEGVDPQVAELRGHKSKGTIEELENLSNLKPSGLLHVLTNYDEDEGNEGAIDYYFAIATSKECPKGFTQLNVPACTWAVFEVEG